MRGLPVNPAAWLILAALVATLIAAAWKGTGRNQPDIDEKD